MYDKMNIVLLEILKYIIIKYEHQDSDNPYKIVLYSNLCWLRLHVNEP